MSAARYRGGKSCLLRIRSILCFCLLLGRLSAARAELPVPVWETTLQGLNNDSTGLSVMTSRILVDGSALVVTLEWPSISFRSYGFDGRLLSTATVYGYWSTPAAAIDAFGAVFVSDYVFASARSELRTMRYDRFSGAPTWAAPARLAIGSNPISGAPLLAVAPDGDLLVTSTVGDWPDNGFFLLRYAAGDGVARWGPTPLPSAGLSYGSANALAVDSAGDVVVTGIGFGATSGTWLTSRFDGATGVLLWGPQSLGVPFVQMACPSSCFVPIVARLSFNAHRDVVLSVSSFEGDAEQWLTTLYERDTGAVRWGPVVFPGTASMYESPLDLAVDSTDGVLVVGTQANTGLVILKYNGATGQLVWGPVTLSAVELTSYGGFVVTGTGDPVVMGIAGGAQIISTNAVRFRGRDGTIAWQRTLQTDTGSGTPSQLLSVGNGTAVLVETLTSEGGPLRVRMGSFGLGNGAGLWKVDFGAAASPAVPVALLVDVSGDSFVVAQFLNGRRTGGGIVKYGGSTGSTRWGPVPFDDDSWFVSSPIAAALDRAGDLFVTGLVADDVHSFWHTTKYSGSTGERLWGPAAFDPGAYGSAPAALAVDPSGDPIVTGTARNGWATIKYRGATGETIWGPERLDSPDLGYSSPASITTDAAGGVFVSGWTFDGQRDQAAVVKYDAATGGTLWGPTLVNRASSSSDQFGLSAVDQHGDIVLAGASRDVGDSIATWELVKCAGATGAIRWNRIPSPSIPNYVGTLDLDPAGDIVVTVSGYSSLGVAKCAGSDGSVVWGPQSLPGARFAANAAATIDAEGNPIVVAAAEPAGWIAIAYNGSLGNPVWGPAPFGEADSAQPSFLQSVPGGSYVVTGTRPGSAFTAAFTTGLGIATPPGALPPAYCGSGYDAQLGGSNGSPPYLWNVVSGALPPGVALDASGRIVGVPTESGQFSFRVRISDVTGKSVDQDFVINVFDAGESVPILLGADSDCVALSVAGEFTAYRWYPGGWTTPTIRACPADRALYGVVVTEASGCHRQGSIVVPPQPPAPRAIATPPPDQRTTRVVERP